MKSYKWMTTLLVMVALMAISNDAFAAGDEWKHGVGMGAGLGIGLAVIGGAIGQGMAARAALEGIARNPNAAGKIQVPMIIGLALIESLVIYALVVTYSMQGYIAG